LIKMALLKMLSFCNQAPSQGLIVQQVKSGDVIALNLIW
jgi:hypothetical protein